MANGCISANATNGDSSLHHVDSRFRASPVVRQVSSGRRRMVLGCGSNVVSHVYRVQGIAICVM